MTEQRPNNSVIKYLSILDSDPCRIVDGVMFLFIVIGASTVRRHFLVDIFSFLFIATFYLFTATKKKNSAATVDTFVSHISLYFYSLYILIQLELKLSD